MKPNVFTKKLGEINTLLNSKIKMQKSKLQSKNQKWPQVELGEVLKYEQPTKYIVHSANYKNEFPIPVLTAGKTFILGNTNEKKGIFPKEKLPVIIFDDFTTATKFVDFPFKVKSSAMKILHTRKSIADAKYLFYLIQTIQFSHKQHKRYWISKYSRIEILLPPLEEQKRIVEKIEKLFAKIDEASRLRTESSAASAALLPSALHQVFFRAEKENWPTKKLGELCEVVAGGTPSTSVPDYWNGDILWVTPKDLGTLHSLEISDTERKIAKVGLENSSTKLLPPGAVILSTRAPIGHLAIATKPVTTNQGCKAFVCSRVVHNRYLYWVLKQNVEKLRALGSGATFTEISKKVVENFKIPIPPIAEQKKIVAYLDSLSAKSRELQNLQSQTAADFSALRQSILTQVFTP